MEITRIYFPVLGLFIVLDVYVRAVMQMYICPPLAILHLSSLNTTLGLATTKFQCAITAAQQNAIGFLFEDGSCTSLGVGTTTASTATIKHVVCFKYPDDQQLDEVARNKNTYASPHL
ncbi:hypothetical protein SK128_022975 [Halocaridina rubra]|uniref:Uncharacterized protein n=1 Tax=Halocaridina rubra TaxID=373956 RepID=A0AAN8WKR6_HALRR